MLSSLVLMQALVVGSHGGVLLSATVRSQDKVTRAEVMRDGTAVWEGDNWDTAKTAIIGKDGFIEFDLGEELPIGAVLIQADNNDNYFLDGSTDGKSWTQLWKAQPDPLPGMRTRINKTLNGRARYLKLYARGGDNLFSVGELQVFTSAALLDGETVKYDPTPPPPPKPPVKFDLSLIIVFGLTAAMIYFFAYRPKRKDLTAAPVAPTPSEVPAEKK